jgi:hypothetical protein
VRQEKRTERGEKRACGFGRVGLGELGSAHSRYCGGRKTGPRPEKKRGKAGPSGRNQRTVNSYFFFSFSIISNAFSQDSWNNFPLKIKTNHQIKYASACMHKHLFNPYIWFYLNNIISLG